MASRPNIQSYQVITDGDMSAASITSSVSVIPQVTVGSYAFSWAGTSPVGYITVEVSNDYAPGGVDGKRFNAGTWTELYFTLNGSTVTNQLPVAGNTGTGFVEWSTAAYAIRTKFTKTSGTGTLQGYINAKVA
jgi:hypothetical protein